MGSVLRGRAGPGTVNATPRPGYWRRIAAPIIAEVIGRVGTEDRKALRKALLEAYPFKLRRYHPYRIWRDEIRRQLNPEKKACIRRPKAFQPPNPDQLTLL
jgi:hypothetical protein